MSEDLNKENNEVVNDNTSMEPAPPAETPAVESVEATEESKTVEVPKEVLSQLLERIEASETLNKQLVESEKNRSDEMAVMRQKLSEMSKDQIPFAETVKDHVLRLRVVDGKPVIGFHNKSKMPNRTKYVYQEVDPNDKTQVNEYIDVLLLGEKEPRKMLYLEEFMSSDDVIECKIIETKKEQKEISHGVVDKIAYNHGDYSSSLAGYKVPVKTLYDVITHKVELPEGFYPESGERQIEVSEYVVNPN